MDFNVYWLVKKSDSENVSYCIKNFFPKKFYVGSIKKLDGFQRLKVLDESLEGKIFSFKKTKDIFSFFANGEKIYSFNSDKKGFSLKYRLDEKSKEYTILTNTNSKNGDYLEISFHGKIEVEHAESERAIGIPFYNIKKS